jgi:hypothetical protein
MPRAIQGRPAPRFRSTRKVVSILFTDLAGFLADRETLTSGHAPALLHLREASWRGGATVESSSATP